MRDGVIVANRNREAAVNTEFPFHGLMDGVDTEDEANMARWFNRFRDMRRNPGLEYRTPDVPPSWADERGLPRAAALDSQSYVEAEFADWLVSQGTSLEALKQNPRELQNKLDEFLTQRGGGDPADEILQYVAGIKGEDLAGVDPIGEVGTSDLNGSAANTTARPIDLLPGVSDGGGKAGPAGSSLSGTGDLLEGLGLAGINPRHSFRKGAPFAGYDDFEDCESQNQDKGDTGAYCGEIKHRTEDKHAFTNTTGPWSGKTPAGPQGPGVGGLKQKTKYKGVSTPALRALQRRVMTTPNAGFDMNELLRELSFREVLGAIHDITAPGATEDSDGITNKRTDPTMSAPVDWSRRRSDGKWTRGDGHITSSKVFHGVPS